MTTGSHTLPIGKNGVKKFCVMPKPAKIVARGTALSTFTTKFPYRKEGPILYITSACFAKSAMKGGTAGEHSNTVKMPNRDPLPKN